MENINIYKYSRLSQSEILNLCKRAESNLFDYFKIVDEIIKNVIKIYRKLSRLNCQKT